MPLKDPSGYQSQSAWMSYCVPEMSKHHPRDQTLRVCLDEWRNKGGGPKGSASCPAPNEGESAKDYLSRCMDAGNSSEECMLAWRKTKGAMPMEHVLSILSIKQKMELRREQLDGKEYIILPMVALVQGTFACANCSGANFYATAEWGKNVGAWNGRPVTLGHPQRDGAYVSAASPDVWEKERIGTLFNARVVDGEKLHVEAWIDPDALVRAGADDLIERIEAGDQIEVSTGTWMDEVPRIGSHNGREYRAVASNFQPDHVAILMNEVGACSWADGCGVRVASASLDEIQSFGAAPAESAQQAPPKAGCCDACSRGEQCERDADHHDLRAAIEAAIEDGSAASVLADYAFHIQEDGEMADDPKTKGETATQDPPSDDAKHEEPKAAASAQHEATAGERRMAMLQAKIEHLEQKLAEKPKPATLDEYIAQAPAEFRPSILSAVKASERRRLELIDRVKASPGNMYTDEKLNSMTEDELVPLVALAARTDFSVRPPERGSGGRSYGIPGYDERDYAPMPQSPWDKPAKQEG